MIALRVWFPRESTLESIGGIVMFVSSLSFLLPTPGMWTIIEVLPVPTVCGAIMKDLTFLGVTIWTYGEALQHAHAERNG